MTALADNYEHEYAEDDPQHSSIALLCMTDIVLPFSQQLLQIAIAQNLPLVLVHLFFHVVSNQDGKLFSAHHMLYVLLRPPL